MNITKIKVKPDTVETKIMYNMSEDRNSKEVTFDSYDQGTKEWHNCLQVLKDFVLKVLELPEEYGEDMMITGLTIKHEQDGRGYVISAQKKIKYIPAPLCINTPYLAPNRENNTSVVDVRTDLQIEKILEMAAEFLQGKHRAQREMF